MSTVPGPCRFDFRDVVCGFFDLATEDARAILPAGIEPVERNHCQSVLAVLVFDFHGGFLGAYTEVVLAIVVAPLVEPGVPIPHSAMYPFLLGTSTTRARLHGMEQYRLPHHGSDVEMRFDRHANQVTVVGIEGRPFVELTVTRPPGVPSTTVRHKYQIFANDVEGTYVSDVFMAGDLVDHEEETGGMTLFPHAFTEMLGAAELAPIPFREQWMSGGSETYYPVRLVARGRPGRGSGGS